MRHAIICTAICGLSFIAANETLAAGRVGAGIGVGGGAMHSGTTFGTAAIARKPATLGPSHTGQPSQSCGSVTAPNTPGNSAMAPGSAFNPDGKSGTVYAGEQPQNSRNTASVSQYDVACARQ